MYTFCNITSLLWFPTCVCLFYDFIYIRLYPRGGFFAWPQPFIQYLLKIIVFSIAKIEICIYVLSFKTKGRNFMIITRVLAIMMCGQLSDNLRENKPSRMETFLFFKGMVSCKWHEWNEMMEQYLFLNKYHLK